MDPASRDEGFRRLLATWSEEAYDDHTMLLTLARRPGLLRALMGFVRYVYGESRIEPRLSFEAESRGEVMSLPHLGLRPARVYGGGVGA